MKKRLFALFLVLTMVLGMLPVTAAAQEEKLYGEVPMYLGYADVDYMAEQVLKEIQVTGDTAEERIRQVYDWIIYNCDRSGTPNEAYFDPDEVMKKSQEGSKPLQPAGSSFAQYGPAQWRFQGFSSCRWLWG